MLTFALGLFDGSFWAGVATAVGLLLIIHWLPVPRLVPPTVALICKYIVGVSALLAGVLVWLLTQRLPEIAIGVMLICAFGGAAVISAHTIDWLVGLVKKGLKAERLMRNGPSSE